MAWIHSYYGQNGVWNIQAKQASWVVQRILKATQHLQEAGYTEAGIRDMEKYSIGKVYMQMRGTMEKVQWRSLVWTNLGLLSGYLFCI